MKYGNNICKCCKKELENMQEFDTNLEVPKLMVSQNLCFDCAFWQKLLDFKDNIKPKIPGLSIVTGSNYEPSAKLDRKYYWFIPFILPSGKSNIEFQPVSLIQPKHRIINKKGELYTVNDIWAGIEIPTIWYPKFKVNAKFLTDYETLNLISRRDTKVDEEFTCYRINKEIVAKLFNE